MISPQDVVPRFERFAANWGVPVTEDTLKMFLACAADTALWRTGREDLPDDEWDQLVAESTALLVQR